MLDGTAASSVVGGYVAYPVPLPCPGSSHLRRRGCRHRCGVDRPRRERRSTDAEMGPGPRPAAGQRRPVRRVLRRHGRWPASAPTTATSRRTVRRRCRCGATCTPATSSRRRSRTGSPSSCRWACTSSSPPTCSSAARRSPSRWTSGPAGRGPAGRGQARHVPWPVRRGGLVLSLYENSLAALFFVLFAASIALHAVGGARAYSAEQLAHGEAPVSAWGFVRTAAVLVRVVPELAVGVPRGRGDRRRLGVPAAARVGRVEAGRRAAPRHRLLTRPPGLPAAGRTWPRTGRRT